jgi:hypothetical protein
MFARTFEIAAEHVIYRKEPAFVVKKIGPVKGMKSKWSALTQHAPLIWRCASQGLD